MPSGSPGVRIQLWIRGMGGGIGVVGWGGVFVHMRAYFLEASKWTQWWFGPRTFPTARGVESGPPSVRVLLVPNNAAIRQL